jgi:Tfp pilus assembly protein PilN
MQKKSPSINLVKKKVDYIDEFIKWALSIGRLVVILTEIVALMTFLYRFSLDQKLIDLHSKIKQEATIISFLKDQEATYRNLQDRLTVAESISEKSQNTVKIYSDIRKNVPTDVNIDNLSIFQEGIRIQSTFRSVSSLSKFVKFLRNYDQISTVSIDKIENKSSNATIVVQLTALLKKNNQK